MVNSIEVMEFLSSEPDIVNSLYLVPTKIFTDGYYEWTMMIPYLVKNIEQLYLMNLLSILKNKAYSPMKK